MLNNTYQKYQSASVYTATPSELTLMLYNGAIKFCNLGIEALEKKDMFKANYNIKRVQDIVVELQSTLDDKYPIAKEIDSLYDFIKRLLIEANIEKSVIKLQDAAMLLREFRDTWQSAMKLARQA